MRRFFGIDIADGPTPLPPSGAAQQRRIAAFLRPKPSAVPLRRIGGTGDGAYLVPDDLEGIAACFSPGVSDRKEFEDALCRDHGIPSHMCDFSSDAGRMATPLIPGAQTFARKWLEPEAGADALCLPGWIDALAPGTDDLMLQMDIEGAEYRNLLATPREVLRRFRIIVLELHGLWGLNDAGIFTGVLRPFFLGLAEDFVSVHAHPNNCAPQLMLAHARTRVPRVLELTLHRADRLAGVPAAARIAPQLPHPLDIGRNVRSKPPEFLDPDWMEGPEPPACRIRRLEAELSFARDEAVSARAADTLQDAITRALSWMLMTTVAGGAGAAGALPGAAAAGGASGAADPDAEAGAGSGAGSGAESGVAHPPAAPRSEIAAGKPFSLDAAHGRAPRHGTVAGKAPFFFHTAVGVGARITVDLLAEYWVEEIVIANRTDGLALARPAVLFAILHRDPDPAGGRGVFFPLDAAFLEGRAPRAALMLAPERARHVTLTSPLRTALHFSDLAIFGRPADAPPGSTAGPIADPSPTPAGRTPPP